MISGAGYEQISDLHDQLTQDVILDASAGRPSSVHACVCVCACVCVRVCVCTCVCVCVCVYE